MRVFSGLVDCCLVHGYVARASMNGNNRAAATHLANHTLPRFLNAALDGRSHRMPQSDGSGTRRDVDIESGGGGASQGHVSGAGADAPHVLGRAVAVNVAAARLGVKSAIDAVDRDVTASGADVHVARAHFLDFNVATARFDLRGTGKIAPADVSRSRLEAHFTGKARQAQVAGPALEIDVALEAFDRLIAATGMGANRGVLRHGNFVVDRNVVVVHVVDADAVASLANRRMILQLLHLGLVVAAKPGIARLNLGMNRNRARRAVPTRDVAGASQHFEVDGSADLERTVKGSDDRGEPGQRSS